MGPYYCVICFALYHWLRLGSDYRIGWISIFHFLESCHLFAFSLEIVL